MSSDVFTKISHESSNHPVCQDYSRSGVADLSGEANHYVILSDGCSSAADSDVGARLLTFALEAQMPVSRRPDLNLASFVAQLQQKAIDVPRSCLQATLLSVTSDDSKFYAVIGGDGMVFARRRTGDIEVTHYEWTSGAPFYPSYAVNPADSAEYRKRFCLDQHKLLMKVRYFPSGIAGPSSEIVNDFLAITSNTFFAFEFSKHDYDLVGCATDGLASFRDYNKPERPLIATEDMIREFLNLKGYAGKFVLRRCIQGFKTLYDKKWYNDDDFSIGMVVDRPGEMT